jgi:DNA repair exonuclease SbcCD nuclease subunit
VVFLGDNLNRRNNSSTVIREFVEFVECFENKSVVIVAGNHEKTGDGKSAIDFMKKVRGKKNWRIVTDDCTGLTLGGLKLTFQPYFFKSELAVQDNEEAAKELLRRLPSGQKRDILFTHNFISGTKDPHGQSVEVFGDVVLPREELLKKYRLVVGGHNHKHQIGDGVAVVGSTFSNEVGDKKKYVLKIDEKTLKVTPVELPVRPIVKLEDPTMNERLSKDSIVKVVLTKKLSKEKLDELKKHYRKYDAFILVEQYPRERKKVHFEDGMIQFTVEELLDLYAKEQKVDAAKLRLAWDLIKE